jgi:tRNA(fMet)-specific endonuclease VapC
VKYLLDIDICIHLIRYRPAALLNRLRACTPSQIEISTITIAELQYGAQRSKEPQRNLLALEQFLLPLGIADFDFEAATAYGGIRAKLEAMGATIGPLDMLIAAIAVAHDQIVVTNNVREFSRVPELRVENWLGDTSTPSIK